MTRKRDRKLSAARPDREGDADDGAADDVRMPAIPLALLTRVLHEFFDKKGTRVTRDANDAVAKYMDVFVREAIARAAAEKRSGFFEVRALPCPALRAAGLVGRPAWLAGWLACWLTGVCASLG